MAKATYANMLEILQTSVRAHGARDLFGTKINGQWVWTSYQEFGKLVDAFRGGLASLGLQSGDRVAIISNNRVEWAVAAYACFGLGIAFVPMYEAQLPKEWAFIINDCGASAIITATAAIHTSCRELQEKAPTLKHLIGLALPKSDPLSYEALIEVGKKTPCPTIDAQPDTTACLIYTSGTTGNPKGVILTHGNLASNITSIRECHDIDPSEQSLSFLPWAHSFGQTMDLHYLLSAGASMAICESIDKLLPNLAEIRPTILMSVPRIFNRVYDAVIAQMKGRPVVIQRLFQAGLDASAKRRKGQPLNLVERLTLAVADRVIFTKVRGRFGGRLKYSIVGGAALSRDVGDFMESLGVLALVGYGLSETSPSVSGSTPTRYRLGSVGQVIPGVKVNIDTSVTSDPKHGELVVYGPNVMKGYFNREEDTKAAFTEDGGFRTGDLGYFDEDGFLYITGRIKEQYKLENGKYIAPAHLEETLRLSPYISNIMVYGDNRLFNVALVVPEMTALKTWAKEQHVTASSDEALLKTPEVIAHIQAEIDKLSRDFKGFERIKKIALIAEDFTTENGMLTPSLKLKRRVALQKYQPMLEALYAGAAKEEKRSSATAN